MSTKTYIYIILFTTAMVATILIPEPLLRATMLASAALLAWSMTA